MINSNSLVKGIGNASIIKRYYDDWSSKYDYTLSKWNYKAPKKSIDLLVKLKIIPKNILDLACGTGLFGEKLIELNKNCKIYGSDISLRSLKIAEEKKIYKSLFHKNFESKLNFRSKFDLVSMIGAMTYCKNFDKLFSNVRIYLIKGGYFIFSHRIDLWKIQKFDKVLENFSGQLKVKFISRPILYLPLNSDFKDKIKIRLVILEKH